MIKKHGGRHIGSEWCQYLTMILFGHTIAHSSLLKEKYQCTLVRDGRFATPLDCQQWMNAFIPTLWRVSILHYHILLYLDGKYFGTRNYSVYSYCNVQDTDNNLVKPSNARNRHNQPSSFWRPQIQHCLEIECLCFWWSWLLLLFCSWFWTASKLEDISSDSSWWPWLLTYSVQPV